jgi:hypothetical protein
MAFLRNIRGIHRIGVIAALALTGLVVVGLTYNIGDWPRGIMGAFGVSADRPAERIFEITIEGGKVAEEMRIIQVRQGDFVTLRWTADRRIKLHLHGYDLEKEVGPGSVTQFAFPAYASGRFPVMVHGVRGEELPDAPPLVRLEVSPR